MPSATLHNDGQSAIAPKPIRNRCRQAHLDQQRDGDYTSLKIHPHPRTRNWMSENDGQKPCDHLLQSTANDFAWNNDARQSHQNRDMSGATRSSTPNQTTALPARNKVLKDRIPMSLQPKILIRDDDFNASTTLADVEYYYSNLLDVASVMFAAIPKIKYDGDNYQTEFKSRKVGYGYLYESTALDELKSRKNITFAIHGLTHERSKDFEFFDPTLLKPERLDEALSIFGQCDIAPRAFVPPHDKILYEWLPHLRHRGLTLCKGLGDKYGFGNIPKSWATIQTYYYGARHILRKHATPMKPTVRQKVPHYHTVRLNSATQVDYLLHTWKSTHPIIFVNHIHNQVPERKEALEHIARLYKNNRIGFWNFR